MPLWTLDTPPTWFPDAELTKEGWLNHATGELLVAMQGEEDRVGPGTGLQRTQTGTARIQITDPQEQLGSAAIQNTTVQVQLGIGRLQVTTDWSIVGGSAVQNTTLQTQTANASVYNTVVQTQTGAGDIQATTTQTLLGGAIVVHTIGLPNLMVEYGFYESSTSEIVDLTSNGNNGTLTGTANYTNLGLRMDGSQVISVPDAALTSSYIPFTVFAIVQPEVYDTSYDIIAQWYGTSPDYYALYYDSNQGFVVDIGETNWSGKYIPTVNVPFAFVQRFNPAGQLDTRIDQGSDQPTKLGIYDFSSYHPVFTGQNGSIGGPFRGTLIYFAIFRGFISNGEMGYLFKFARNLLLVRGTDPLLENTFEEDAFQVGAFQ